MINLAFDIHIADVAKQMDTEDLATVLNAFAAGLILQSDFADIAQALSRDGIRFAKSLAAAADAANADDKWEGVA